MSLAQPPVGQALEVCATLEDSDLAGDCALYVAGRQAALPGGEPEVICPVISPGAWQDECWFVAAEAVNRRGNSARAAELCALAGAFVDDCGQHLWQTGVHRLARDTGPERFQDALPAARVLYERWSPLLQDRTDFEERFWRKLYQNGFESRGRADLAWCRVLPEADRARCEAAALDFYGRELAPRLEQAGVSLCALETADSTAVEPYVGSPADPAYDVLIVQRRAEVCALRTGDGPG